MKKFGVKTIVVAGIGTAIFFLLAHFAAIPVLTNAKTAFQYAALGFFAAIFGPIAGLIIGFFGHGITDLVGSGVLQWSWVIVSAMVGFASGFLFKDNSIETGEFGRKAATRFIVGSALIHLVSWLLIAPVLDILIDAETARNAFTQGLIVGVSNIITTVIVGTLLVYVYSKTRAKPTSLGTE